MLSDEDDEGPPPLPGGKFYMTPQGEISLRERFAGLKAERHRVVEIVAWAASNGDRSENADYKEGKRRLREIDRQLRFIGRRLAAAEVIDPAGQTQIDRVFFGATVTYVGDDDTARTITIVGVDEADMAVAKVSIASPIARALLKARAGDEVKVPTPSGPMTIEVVSIRYG